MMGRFYQNDLPDSDDLVLAQVVKEIQTGFYVKLLEYDNLEAFITLGEISRKKKYIKQRVNIGKITAFEVYKVDEAKRYVDLSKKRVSKEEEDRCKKKYAGGKKFNKIREFIVNQWIQYKYPDGPPVVDEDTEWEPELDDVLQLYSETVWRLYKLHPDVELLDLHKQVLYNPTMLVEGITDTTFKTILLDQLQEAIHIESGTFATEVTMISYQPDGVNDIKGILLGFKDVIPTSPPQYLIRMHCMSEQAAMAEWELHHKSLQESCSDKKIQYRISKEVYAVVAPKATFNA